MLLRDWTAVLSIIHDEAAEALQRAVILMDDEIIKRDARHIQSEIRWLRQQQFLITTAGLTFFGIAVDWLLQNKSSRSEADINHFAVISLLLIILFVLFFLA
jgi:hypothetical protein